MAVTDISRIEGKVLGKLHSNFITVTMHINIMLKIGKDRCTNVRDSKQTPFSSVDGKLATTFNTSLKTHPDKINSQR